GGGVMRTLKSMDPDIQDQLRIYWTSRGYTPHAFAAHPRVTDPDREKLLAALTALDSPEANPEVLQPIRFNGFIKAGDTAWDDVRSLNLTELKVESE
ncbi:MAG: PhnD/SsuA/transferrin family substrate-binding protein, partial [Planctomycetaceae bacterium]